MASCEFLIRVLHVSDVSDNEMSGNESERSNSSRDNDGAHDSTEDEPDSDDSSEMDENECENRRNALLQHVQDLEGQFGLLREQLYRERISQVHGLCFPVRNMFYSLTPGEKSFVLRRLRYLF